MTDQQELTWLIDRSRAISPPSGGKYDAAYLVKLSRGPALREVVVEFAAPSAVASGGYAEEVARRFQRDSELPQHVVLECDGSVRVLKGARAPRPEDDLLTVGEPAPLRSQRRARNHHGRR